MTQKPFFMALALAGLLAATFVASAQNIASFNPPFGKPGTLVAIVGSGFKNPLTVTFNGTVAHNAVIVDQFGTQISATVPAGATTGPIHVNAAQSIDDFVVLTDAPYIASFTPLVGSGLTQVTLQGANFIGTVGVKFNGNAATFLPAAADTQLIVTAPLGVTSGPISVTNAKGTGTSQAVFYAPPVISGFQPAFGAVGDVITITGINFTNALGVKFNGLAAASFTVKSNSVLTAVIPANATIGPITVIAPAGGTTSSSNFLVAPRITSFTPANGSVGDTVTLTGANFTGATAVKFDGVPAVSPTISATSITAKVPAGATTGPISVTTPGGTVASTDLFYLAPRVSGFSPAGGEVGSLVTVTGTNFTGATAVKFSGISALNFVFVDDNHLTATVPTNATTGPVSVTAPGGTGTTGTNFTVFTTSDLAVGQTAAPAAVVVGNPITYSITVTNFGSKSATAVTVKDTLSPLMQFVSATSSVGSCTRVGNLVTCNLGTLNSQAVVTLSITAAAVTVGPATNRVSVSANEPDPNSANNLSNLATQINDVVLPGLAVARVTDGVKVSWPTSASDFHLQVTGTFSAWTNVTATPGVVGNQNTLTFDPAIAPQFYRLKKP